MMFIFLGFALFTGAVDEKFKVTSKSKLFGLVLLIVFMNLEGVRLVQAFGVPLMGAIVIYYFLSERENEEKSRLFKDIIKILLILGGAEAAGVLGFMILNSLLRNNNTSSSFYFINSTEFFDNFKNFITSWGDIIGISVMERVTTGYVTASAKLISPRGLLTLIKIMLNICLLLILPAIQIKNYKKQPFGIKLFIIFTVIHITETVVLFLFTTSGSLPINRYWFSSTWLLYGLSCTYVYELYQKAGDKPLKAVIAAGMIAAVLPGAWEMGSLVKMYYSEPSSQRDVFAYDVERLERLCEHLEDKGLSYGYSTYWNAGVISALSNRQILVNGISVLDKICPSEHLVSSYYYNEEAFSGSTFLLLTADENQKFTNSRNYGLYGQPLYIDQVENFYVYVYDYNIAKNDFSGNVNFSGPFASDLSITFSEVSENGYYLTDGTEGYCMFGPNARTEPGTYRFTLNYSVIESADSEAAGNFDVSVNAGSEILGSSQIYINSDSITLDVTFSGDETFEYKIWNYSGSVIEIQSVEMEKIS
ncbi:MAG: hypothetical protein K2K57_14645 [Oscillospiraceae bacterium]|nr:hypothetical protein [Oscillospiraceae bacterium]